MPEELRMQVPVLKEVLDALNIPRYELEGWEADDLLGTISRAALSKIQRRRGCRARPGSSGAGCRNRPPSGSSTALNPFT